MSAAFKCDICKDFNETRPAVMTLLRSHLNDIEGAVSPQRYELCKSCEHRAVELITKPPAKPARRGLPAEAMGD